MKFNHYKCYIVAAAITMGITLTACGAGETKEDVKDQVETSVSDDVEGASTEITETEIDSDETNDEAATESKADETESTKPEEAVSSETDTAVTMYTTESITLHKEASGSGEDLGVVPVGSTVQAYEVSGDYIRVSYDGNEGYVLKDYVTDDKDAADNALKASIEQNSKSASKSDGEKSSDKKKSKKKSTECLENGLLN